MMNNKQLQLRWISGEKQCFVDVSVEDLVAHFKNNELAKEVISEALFFAESNGGKLRFWRCCLCNEKFVDSEQHIQHVKSAHLKYSLADYSSQFPLRVNSDWRSMILNGTWKPIDVSAAWTIIQEQLENMHFGGNEGFDVENRNPTTDYPSFVSTPESPSNKSGVRFIFDDLEYREKLLARKLPFQKWAKEYTSTCSWPLSDDIERDAMLTRIQKMLEVLMLNESLTESHVDRMTRYTKLELERIFPNINVLLLCLTETHVCFCFLGVSQLQKIINLLEEISQFAVRRMSEKDDDNIILSTGTKDNSFVKGDLLCILLDKPPGGASNSEISGSDEEYLESWTHIRKERNNQGKELLKTLDEKFDVLEYMLASKCNRISNTKKLGYVWLFYIDELWERMGDDKHVPQSYETILEKLKIENWGSYFTKDISDILEEAQSTTHEALVDVPVPYFFDVDSFGKGCSKEIIQADNDTVDAVKRLSQKIDIELIKYDARILQLLVETEKLELKINSFADFDYGAVLLPLVKSYIQAII
ncbi:hypothetical protein ACHQM5_015195 [Ranunculus cassubicifolius]